MITMVSKKPQGVIQEAGLNRRKRITEYSILFAVQVSKLQDLL